MSGGKNGGGEGVGHDGCGEDDGGSVGRGVGGWCEEKTAATSVPIEVLLRLCDRSVRGARCHWGGVFSESPPSEGEATPACARGNTAATKHFDVAGKTEDSSWRTRRSHESWAESPERNVRLAGAAAADETTNAALPLPPGITSALAQQVGRCRGDRRSMAGSGGVP